MSKALRLLLFVALLALVWAVAEWFGLRERLTAEGVQQLVADAGAAGVLLYLAVFALGVLAQIPGVAFLIAARVAFGPGAAFAIGYVGAVTAVMLSFLTARVVGGRALSELTWAPARRVLDRVGSRPVCTIAALRVFMVASPPLNVALALSQVRGRDYLLGSAIGLVVPVALWTGMFGLLI